MARCPTIEPHIPDDQIPILTIMGVLIIALFIFNGQLNATQKAYEQFYKQGQLGQIMLIPIPATQADSAWITIYNGTNTTVPAKEVIINITSGGYNH